MKTSPLYQGVALEGQKPAPKPVQTKIVVIRDPDAFSDVVMTDEDVKALNDASSKPVQNVADTRRAVPVYRPAQSTEISEDRTAELLAEGVELQRETTERTAKTLHRLAVALRRDGTERKTP